MGAVPSHKFDGSGSRGALPNLIIIGAQKCGTTALHSYLARHPNVFMSRPKELNFFVDNSHEGNWYRGIDWYRNQFDPDYQVRGESSPNYTMDPILPGVAARAAGVVPDAKLIFMVRDPVERVRSGYIHHYANWRESRPLEEAVLDANSSYVMRSRYHHQLSSWLEHFPLERVLVVSQDEMRQARRPSLKRVWRFLGIRENVWREGFKIQRLKTEKLRRKTVIGSHVSRRVSAARWHQIENIRLLGWRPLARLVEQPELPDLVRAGLIEMLQEDVERFRALTGLAFEDWSI